jgi:hypothetical protein
MISEIRAESDDVDAMEETHREQALSDLHSLQSLLQPRAARYIVPA